MKSAFATHKIESGHFYSCPPGKSLLDSYHHTQADGNISSSKAAVFWKPFPSQAERGRKVRIKINSNKNNLLMILPEFQSSNLLSKHFPRIQINNFHFSRIKANVMNFSSLGWFLFCSYFLFPSSNKNNCIYLRSSEQGKHYKKKKKKISSSDVVCGGVVLSFIF